MEEMLLNPLQARLLGCLMEKKETTPDQYPLTLNAIKSACNQKTARHPVMNCEEGEIGHRKDRKNAYMYVIAMSYPNHFII